MNRSSVTILGGGLCGALLSIMLARRGMKVTLLERQPDPRVRMVASGRSINLVLAARGIRALNHAGIFDQVSSLLVPMKGRLIHATDGSTEFHAYGSRENEVIHSVSRAGLNRALIDAADQQHGVDIRFGHEAVAYYPDQHRLRIRDLQKASDYDLRASPLIAADGAGSVVRRAFRGRKTIDATEELLAHAYKELTVPAGPGRKFQMDPAALHIWPRGGYMLIALPNPSGDFTLTLFLPTDGDPGFTTLDSAEKVDAFFRAQFADVRPLIDDLAGTWQKNPVGILGTVRSRHWHDGGKVLLIGDAAHAIVPFHGQGMNLSFEDCVVLDQVLDNPAAGWSTVFEVFENEQLANANAIADMALENYVEMRDTVRDPKHVLRHDLAFALEQRLPGRFIPRYSMVMFHDEIPYALARKRGATQQTLLQELTESADSMDDIDLDAAVALAQSRLPPIH
jgi:kynurenine 3-monooxygenase